MTTTSKLEYACKSGIERVSTTSDFDDGETVSHVYFKNGAIEVVTDRELMLIKAAHAGNY